MSERQAVPIPIILDCDPGHDDAIALLLAVESPRIDLRAVTTTFGNCSVDDATRNPGSTEHPHLTARVGPFAGFDG